MVAETGYVFGARFLLRFATSWGDFGGPRGIFGRVRSPLAGSFVLPGGSREPPVGPGEPKKGRTFLTWESATFFRCHGRPLDAPEEPMGPPEPVLGSPPGTFRKAPKPRRAPGSPGVSLIAFLLSGIWSLMLIPNITSNYQHFIRGNQSLHIHLDRRLATKAALRRPCRR